MLSTGAASSNRQVFLLRTSNSDTPSLTTSVHYIGRIHTTPAALSNLPHPLYHIPPHPCITLFPTNPNTVPASHDKRNLPLVQPSLSRTISLTNSISKSEDKQRPPHPLGRALPVTSIDVLQCGAEKVCYVVRRQQLAAAAKRCPRREKACQGQVRPEEKLLRRSSLAPEAADPHASCQRLVGLNRREVRRENPELRLRCRQLRSRQDAAVLAKGRRCEGTTATGSRHRNCAPGKSLALPLSLTSTCSATKKLRLEE